MKRLHQILGLILALLWVPITSHCELEDIHGFEFVKCETSAPTPDQDCNGDVCADLENPNYRVSETDAEIPFPPIAVLIVTLVAEPDASHETRATIQTSPEITSGWQFYYRTALPPRAPSLAS